MPNETLSSEFNPLKTSRAPAMDVWWKLPKKDVSVSDAVIQIVDTLRTEQTQLASLYRRCIEMYENVSVGNLLAWNFCGSVDQDGPYEYNAIEQIIDTVHAEIITNRTRPQFFTEGGDWLAQNRADKLTSFVDGMFAEAEIHEVVAPAVALDAMIFGTGIAKVFSSAGKVYAERVFPYDVIVDEIGAAMSSPTTMYHVKVCSRDFALNMFSDDKKAMRAIHDAKEFDSSDFRSRAVRDLVCLYEAWNLPCGDKPGRHVIAIDSAVLVDEEWKHKWFPFAMLRYKSRTKGFWGKGVSEILAGRQELINDLHDKVTAQIQLTSPFLWIKPGARIRESGLSNELGRVIESDEPPQYIVPNATAPDLLNRLAQEINDAGMLIGANTLMMKSELPPGLNSGSGRALRIYNDTKTKRFMKFARSYESWHIELCNMMVETADDAHDDGETVDVLHEDKNSVERITYADIKLPKGEYVIRAQPVNFLSDTPSGRLSDVEAMAAIAPEEMKGMLIQYLQGPDTKALTRFLNADEDAIEKACGSILAGKRTAAEVAPTAYLNLDRAISIARTLLLQAQTQGAPVERTLDLENWIAMCAALQKKAAPPAPPAAPPMPEGPAMPPMV